MKITLGENSIDVDRAVSVFEAIGELNEQLADQNNRFSEVQDVFGAEPGILALAEQAIAGEQRETFTDLLEIGRSSAELCTLIGSLCISHTQELDEAQATAETLRAESEAKSEEMERHKQELEESEKTKIDKILGNIQRLAPKALEQVQVLLNERLKHTASSQELVGLEDEILRLLTGIDEQERRIAELTSQKPIIENLNVQAQRAWVRPLALAKVLGTDIAQWVLIDEMPVEPNLKPSGHDRYLALRERHIDQPEASIYAALYLSDHVNETVTVDDIAKFLYGDEILGSAGNIDIRSRVTTLLGPAREHLPKILMNEGYVLQYGWRRKLERNGDGVASIKYRRRIYRAVALEDLRALEDTSSVQDGITDDFEVTAEITELLAEFNRSKEAEARDSTVTSEGVTGPQQTFLADAPGGTSPARPQQSLDHVPVAANTEGSESVPEWAKEFRREIGQALSELEKEGLLPSNGGVLIKVARAKSSSGIFATTTGIERLRNAGYLKSLTGINRSHWPNQWILPEEMVIMKLFNNNPDILGKSHSRRIIALELIDQAVEAYFRNREEN